MSACRAPDWLQAAAEQRPAAAAVPVAAPPHSRRSLLSLATLSLALVCQGAAFQSANASSSIYVQQISVRPKHRLKLSRAVPTVPQAAGRPAHAALSENAGGVDSASSPLIQVRRETPAGLGVCPWFRDPSGEEAQFEPRHPRLLQELLRRTEEKREERKKERLDDYYRRNFGDYLAFQVGRGVADSSTVDGAVATGCTHVPTQLVGTCRCTVLPCSAHLCIIQPPAKCCCSSMLHLAGGQRHGAGGQRERRGNPALAGEEHGTALPPAAQTVASSLLGLPGSRLLAPAHKCELRLQDALVYSNVCKMSVKAVGKKGQGRVDRREKRGSAGWEGTGEGRYKDLGRRALAKGERVRAQAAGDARRLGGPVRCCGPGANCASLRLGCGVVGRPLHPHPALRQRGWRGGRQPMRRAGSSSRSSRSNVPGSRKAAGAAAGAGGTPPFPPPHRLRRLDQVLHRQQVALVLGVVALGWGGGRGVSGEGGKLGGVVVGDGARESA